MLRARRDGYTLTDLLATIVVIAVVLGLVAPAIRTQRTHCGRTSCMTNMRQIGLAFINFDAAQNRLPNSGTWASEMDVDGTTTGGAAWPGGPDDPAVNDIRWDFPLHSWVVDILPYMERPDIADQWTLTEKCNDASGRLALFDEPDRKRPIRGLTPSGSAESTQKNNALKGNSASHYQLSQTYLALLICPDDDSIVRDKGNLSFTVNGGPVLLWQNPMSNGATPVRLAFTDGGLSPSDSDFIYSPENDPIAARNLGLMVPGSLHGRTPWDKRRSLAQVPDGTSSTIMLGENIRAGYDARASTTWYDPKHVGQPGRGLTESTWSNPDPNYCTFRFSDDFCDKAGQCNRGPSSTILLGTTEYSVNRPDWSKANHRDSRDNSRGESESINGALTTGEGWPYLTSTHPGGIHVVLCDGSARFISQDIDGTVFAKLMSPAGTRRMKEHWAVRQEPLDEF